LWALDLQLTHRTIWTVNWEGIFSWLIAIAMTFIAIVLYRHSIRRLRSLPMLVSGRDYSAGFLLFCAGFVGIWALQLHTADRTHFQRTCELNGLLADCTGHDHYRHCLVQAFEPTAAIATRATPA